MLETIKQQQDQLVAKVNYLSCRMNSTPGPDVEMPDNINLPLEHLEAVEAFEVFLKEPSNYPARQRVTLKRTEGVVEEIETLKSDLEFTDEDILQWVKD
ncbi:unnamed protein product [Gadus morhua 'NCC']